MQIRKAALEDLDRILEIYAYARKFMRENGNPDQWKDSYPPKDTLLTDISSEKLHLCVDGEKILAVFYYAKEDEPTYHEIDGQWINNKPYAVAHRVASAEGSKGAATFCLNWAFEQSGDLRIDTHTDNKPMQGLLKKLGFVYCGKIKLEDGSPRIAFEKVRA